MAEATLVGPQSQSEGGPVGPPPDLPGIADAPAISHNPAAQVFANPAAIHNPLIRVMSKIGSAVTSPGVIKAAHDTLGLIQAVGQGAEEGLKPAVGANVIKSQEQPIANAQKQQALDEKAAADKAAQGAKEREDNLKQQVAQSNEAAKLRRAGLKPNPQAGGMPIPLAPEDMSEKEKGLAAASEASTALAKARADVENSKLDPNSPEYQAAKQKFDLAQKDYNLRAEALGLRKDEYKLKAAQAAENVGASTSMRTNKADLAHNIQDNTGEAKRLIDDNPDLFGKVAGRFTSVRDMMGSEDPAIAQLGTTIHNIALANNSIHGIRSAQGAETTANYILNKFKNSPEATKAALDEGARSAQTFINAGLAGKKQLPSGTAAKPMYASAPGKPRMISNDGGKTWQQAP